MRAEIVEAYHNKDLIGVCKNIGGDDWQDIRGEVTAKMFEMCDEDYKKIRDVKSFMIFSCRNFGIDTIRKTKNIDLCAEFEDMAEQLTEDEDLSIKIHEKIAEDMANPKKLYHSRVFFYCLTHKNIRAFSNEIGIPYNQVREAYNEYKSYLRNWIKST